MLKTEERQKKVVFESAEGQDEKPKQDGEEQKRETGDINVLIQDQKQMKEHTVTELSLLQNAVSYTHLDVYKRQIIKYSQLKR